MPKDKMVKWNFRAYHITPTEKTNNHENIVIPEFKYRNKEKFIPLHSNEASSKALYSVSNALALSLDVADPVMICPLGDVKERCDVENQQLQVLKFYNNLKVKMADILEANSWLMGGLYRAGSNTFLKISSNKTNAQDFIQEYVDPRLFEKLENESTEESGKPNNNSDSRSSSENSNRKLTDQEKARIFDKFVTPQAIEVLNDDNKKLACFSIIRDTKDICNMTKMYIIVSINHIIGDASTLFKIFNMLNSKTQVISLIVNRVYYQDALARETSLCLSNGRNFLSVFSKKLTRPFLMKSVARSFFSGGKSADYNTRVFKYKINQEEVERIKNDYNSLETESKRQNNLLISTNDVITHWFFSLNPKSDNVLMALDLRNRLSIINENHAGNYLGHLLLRTEHLKTPVSIRKALVDACYKKPPGYMKVPNYSDFRKYPIGTTTNWSTLYKPMTIDGFKINHCMPLIDDGKLVRIYGFIKPLTEDMIIIYKCNNDDLAVYIWSGSNTMSTERLDKEKILGERIMSYTID